MLNLFGNLFSRPDAAHSALPAELVKKLIERAVDGTDPRLRIVSGYAKHLRKPAIHAAEHVIGMIDSLPAPTTLDPHALHTCPTLEAMLYSEGQANQILARDAALIEYRAVKPPVALLTALLVVQRREKRGFGVSQIGEQTVNDVPQTTVSFTRHHLLEPAASEEECRRKLKRRAFDHLLAITLGKITTRMETRKELGSRRALLRSKLEIMQRSGAFAAHTGTGEQAKLQASLEQIEQQLSAQGPAENVLESNLDIIAEVLAESEHHLWLQECVLNLDKFYVLHEQPTPSVPQIVCHDLHNSQGQQVMLQLVTLASD